MRDDIGEIYTVRYEAVNAMMLNEFLKEHRKVEEQQATIAELKSNSAKQAATVDQQQKQIEALTATVQRVSEKLELTKAAPRESNDTATNRFACRAGFSATCTSLSPVEKRSLLALALDVSLCLVTRGKSAQCDNLPVTAAEAA